MKNNKVFSFGKVLILSIVFIIIALIFTCVSERLAILPLKINLETMLFTLWSVQATVSTLTIAILALLISLSKEKRYGINILEFMLISNRKFITFQDEILIILLLILSQYIFVANLWLSGSLFLFIVALLIIVRILYVSIKVILFKDYVQQDINNYIKDLITKELNLENISFGGGKNKKIINNLYLHTIEAMKQRDIEILDKNFEMFLLIYELILDKSLDYGNSNVLKQWTKYVNFLGSKAIENQLFEELIEFIANIYSKSLSYKINVELDETIDKLINVYRDGDSYVKLSNLPITKLLNSIYIDSEESMYPKFVRLYYSLLNNNNLNEEEKDILISNITISGMHFKYQEAKKREDSDKDIFLILLNTAKHMIDNGDFNRLIKLFGRIKQTLIFNEYLLKSYLYLACYLYYLAYKEELAKGKKYREFIKSYHNIFMDKELIHTNFWHCYEEVKLTLNQWEWFPQGEVKVLIMEGVIREFFIFFSLSVGRDDFINAIDKDEIFSFLNVNLDIDGNFSEKTWENFMLFKEGFFGDDGQGSSPELENSKYKFINRFWELKSKNYTVMENYSEIIESNLNGIKERVAYNIGQNPLFNNILSTEDKEMNSKSISFKKERIYDLDFFALRKLNKSLAADGNFRKFENFVLNLLIENGFEHSLIDYRQNDKLDLLFDLMHSYSVNGITSLLSGISNTFLYKEKEENKIKYNELSRKLNYKIINNPYWVAFNEEKISVRVQNIDVALKPINEEKLSKLLNKNKIEDNLYKFHITNNIYLYLNKNEAIEFVNLTKVLFSIVVDLELLVKGNKSGFVISIITDK